MKLSNETFESATQDRALPWHATALQDMLRRSEQGGDLSQVLLVNTAPDCGLACFADALTARLLCTDLTEGRPCGKCRGCRQWEADTHPDAITLTADSGKEISVDAARECIEHLQLSRHYQSLRIVRIYLAEQLTRSAANALLKTLEEPSDNTLFMLLSVHPRALLPTIRSRAQQSFLPPPDAAQSIAWMQQMGVGEEDAERWMTLAADRPLRALSMATGADKDDAEPDYAKLIADWQRNPTDLAPAVKALAASRESSLAFVDWLATRSWQEATTALRAASSTEVDAAQQRFALAQQCRSSLVGYTMPALALEALFISWRTLLVQAGASGTVTSKERQTHGN